MTAAQNLAALIRGLVQAAQNLEDSLQGDSLGDVDGARDDLAAALATFTTTPRRTPNISMNAVTKAAQDAREVFDGHKRAKEAVDYMEQLLLAAFRADIADQKPGRSGGRDNPELFSEDLW